MNKKIIAIILILVLITTGLVLAKDKIKKDKPIKLDKKVTKNLNDVGINNPKIGSCIKQDDYTCIAKIKENKGINKDILINYHYCEEYEWINDTEECNEEECFQMGGQFTENCIIWETLTQEEIENEIEKKATELLEKISKTKEKRKLIKEEMTDELNIIFEEKQGR